MLVSDLIYAATRAARILTEPGGTQAPEENSDALLILNQIVDQWAARKAYAYSVGFTSYTLTPNHAPHLIGPGMASPDFAMGVRPVRIESAQLILNSATPNVDVPLNLRDETWWADQRIKSLATNVPTDLYYSPDWPNGSLNLWPVPSFAYGLRLETWTSIAQFASVATTFSAPPAYLKALTLALAEELCIWFGSDPPAGLAERAARARVALQMNNDKSPRISSADFGTRGKPRGDFNYYSGGPA